MEEAFAMRRFPAFLVVLATLATSPLPVAVDGDTGAADTADTAQAQGGRRRRKAWRSRQSGPPAGGGAVYGLGMIGAVIYFFGSARSGWDYVLAVPKASVWPALLVYKMLKSFYG
jgi:hypothetical protein